MQRTRRNCDGPFTVALWEEALRPVWSRSFKVNSCQNFVPVIAWTAKAVFRQSDSVRSDMRAEIGSVRAEIGEFRYGISLPGERAAPVENLIQDRQPLVS